LPSSRLVRAGLLHWGRRVADGGKARRLLAVGNIGGDARHVVGAARSGNALGVQPDDVCPEFAEYLGDTGNQAWTVAASHFDAMGYVRQGAVNGFEVKA